MTPRNAIIVGDALETLARLPEDWFHCVVTSPPYWALRDYGAAGQLGLENSPYCWGWTQGPGAECGKCFVCRMVEVFRGVKRVLRPDGTAWVNMGDSFAQNQIGRTRHNCNNQLGRCRQNHNYAKGKTVPRFGAKPKDMVGMPWALAFALRADGWFLRSEIIWHKRSPMPEPVRDRPTKAHEQIFLLSKSPRYFFDDIAAGEPISQSTAARRRYGYKHFAGSQIESMAHVERRQFADAKTYANAATMPPIRKPRSVWRLSTEPFAGAHFATYPTELVRRCLAAGTSAKGCCGDCGQPSKRQIERKQVWRAKHCDGVAINQTGWKTGCDCKPPRLVPCRVLDPFSGAGTTAMVARRLQLHAVGIEINREYAAMARERIVADAPLWNAEFALLDSIDQIRNTEPAAVG